jgi:hypothetical protein
VPSYKVTRTVVETVVVGDADHGSALREAMGYDHYEWTEGEVIYAVQEIV